MNIKRAYASFLVSLAVTVLFITAAMLTAGCDGCCSDEEETTMSVHGLTQEWVGYRPPRVSGSNSVEPGGRVQRTVLANDSASARTIVWRPDYRLTDVSFDGRQPEPGGPPYIFLNVPGDEDIKIAYTVPENTPEGSTIVSMFTKISSTLTEGNSNTVVKMPVSSNARSQSARSRMEHPMVVPQADEPLDVWNVETWIDPAGITLTTELCQSLVDTARRDEFFFATRMPLAPAEPGSIDRPLPHIFDSPYSQTVKLIDTQYPMTDILTGTLEYRFERFSFLANELPSAPGETWMALGLRDTGPVTCPTGLNLAPGSWSIMAETLLNLSRQPDNCEGCTLRTYYCYEGTDSPLDYFTSQAARTLAAQTEMEATSYQGERDMEIAATEGNITCVGPQLAHLTEQAGVNFIGAPHSAVITPTRPVSLSTGLLNESTGPLTVTVDHSTSLSATWQLYTGTYETPDPAAPPLTPDQELVLQRYIPSYLWFFNDVPTKTQAGAHSLLITVTVVTSPALSTSHNVLLWSGEWVPPTGAVLDQHIYLPLVLRN